MEKKNEFKPYIPADKIVPEFTVTSIVIGIILAIGFRRRKRIPRLIVGMTVSASIPAAVISMGIIRVILRKDSILENNIVQTIGSAGESVAAGAIFTLPALFIWAEEGKIAFPSMMTIFLVALFGGVLGICFMVPLRQALIVEEHGTLPFPEGTACAEVLLAGEEGGAKAGTVFAGLGIAAAYKFIADGFKLFPSEIGYAFKSYTGAQIGIQVLPALAGVGFICGPKISSYMLARRYFKLVCTYAGDRSVRRRRYDLPGLSANRGNARSRRSFRSLEQLHQIYRSRSRCYRRYDQPHQEFPADRSYI